MALTPLHAGGQIFCNTFFDGGRIVRPDTQGSVIVLRGIYVKNQLCPRNRDANGAAISFGARGTR